MEPMPRRPRYPFDVPAQVQPASGATSSFGARTRDLGEGGFCLVCDRPISLGDSLKVQLALIARRPIELIGRVVWTRPETEHRFRCGVRIELCEVPDALQIREEVATLASRQARAALDVSV
jgi:Tfp pilus assembly protein PilZ